MPSRIFSNAREPSLRVFRALGKLPLWKRTLVALVTFGTVVATGAVLFAWLGLAPVAASAGHWPITDWFLHFAMRNAVETRSLGTRVPNLSDPALVLKGAGHYATGCAPCHGAPGESRSLVVQHLTPKPPFLPTRIPHWRAEELFWIVKHGIKFTGMPAWPALEREDEIWAMVAFLQRMPELSPEEYEELAFGARPDGEASPDRLRPLSDPPGPLLGNCIRCHGEQGHGREAGAFPKLAGQNHAYIFASLEAYAQGERHSGVMQAVAAGLSKAGMRELAEHYADQSGDGRLSNRGDSQAISRGETLARDGVPGRGIPSCTDCHGPGTGPRNPYYPELAGQYADYLALQLRLFKSGQRGGTPYAHIMEAAAARLTARQIDDLAVYYASLNQAGR